MRVGVIDDGQRLRAKLFRRAVTLLGGTDIDDVGKTSLYRPEFVGRPWLVLLRAVMRGPSYWTPDERELIAVATSNLNACPYCVRVHTQIARIESGATPDTPRPELTATLTLLEKLTMNPDGVTSADVDIVRAAGVPEDAIVDALHVNLIFNVVNRLAHAFDYSWDSDDHVIAGAQALHRFGYRLPSFLMH